MDETPGLIRPITLNVLGTVLSAGHDRASLDTGLLIRRYRAQIMSPAMRDHVAAVLEELITGYGTSARCRARPYRGYKPDPVKCRRDERTGREGPGTAAGW